MALGYFVWESRFAITTVSPATADKSTVVDSTDEKSTRASRSSVAVLPFTSRSSKEDDVFLADGIHDDLLTQLAKISALKVTSRTSVLGYRGTIKRIPEIAAELGDAGDSFGSGHRSSVSAVFCLGL